MNPKHFHTPSTTRARCPVCHEAVYSRAGIHPQCAVRQSETAKNKAKLSVDLADGVAIDPDSDVAVVGILETTADA